MDSLNMQPLNNNGYNDAPSDISDSTSPSADSFGKPRHSYDSADDGLDGLDSDLEDALIKPTTGRKTPWWRSLPTGGKHSPDSLGTPAYSNHKRRSCWPNFCVFGSISGLAVVAILLFVNLVLGAFTLYWNADVDKTLQHWGQPGTGTEGMSWYPTDFLRDILPIPCHSHNDYWRKVPLFSALRSGFTGVEADVWLFDDDLYVGHNTASLTRNRTFQSLYIDPLVKILEHQNPITDFYNGTGHGVFDTDSGKSLILLVDVKTAGPETWPWVLKQLEPLRERGWLSFVENDKVHTRPVTVVGTGNTPFDVLTANSTYRDAFFDAPLSTMSDDKKKSEKGEKQSDAGQGLSGTTPETEFNELNSYYASVSFGSAVGRIWGMKLSEKQMEIIKAQIKGAHSRGLKVRYWDLPSWPIGLRNHIWDVLVKEGADMLNVDDLKAASQLEW